MFQKEKKVLFIMEIIYFKELKNYDILFCFIVVDFLFGAAKSFNLLNCNN